MTASFDLGVGEELKWTFRWKKWLRERNPNGTTELTLSSWSKEPSGADLVIINDTNDTESTTVFLRGAGSEGEEIVLKNSVETSDGEKPIRHLIVRIVARK